MDQPPLPSPFDVPELRLLILRMLDFDSLQACAVVCKAWHRDSQPLLWERVQVTAIGEKEATPLQLASRLCSIRANAQHIRRLSHYFLDEDDETPIELYAMLIEQCHHLVTFNGDYKDAVEYWLFRTLIKVNKNLQEVVLERAATAAPMPSALADGDIEQQPVADIRLYKALEGHGHLRRLHVDCPLTVEALFSIVETCLSLEILWVGKELVVQEISVSRDNNSSGNMYKASSSFNRTAAAAYPRLKCLDLGGPWHDPRLGRLLESSYCASVKHLGLSGLSAALCACVCKLLYAHHFPLLRRLRLRYGAIHSFQYEAILSCFPEQQLVELELWWPNPRDIQQLVKRQYDSLQRATVFCGDSPAQQAAIIDILARCRRLEKFRVSTESDDHPLDIRFLIGQHWACASRLDMLSIPVQVDTQCSNHKMTSMAAVEKEAICPDRPEWEQAQAVFFKRLGQLKMATYLDVAIQYKPLHREGNKTLSLGSNFLPYLTSGPLSLRSLNLGCQLLIEGVSELQLLKEQLPKLRNITYMQPISDVQREWLKENWQDLNVTIAHTI